MNIYLNSRWISYARFPHYLLRPSLLVSLTVSSVAGVSSLCALAPAQAAVITAADEESEQGIVLAKKSKIAPVGLPSGAFRYIGEKEIAQFTDALETIAAQNKAQVEEVEVLVWQGGGGPKKELPNLLNAAGYNYVAQPPMKMDDGQITAFGSVREDKKNDLLGLWMEQDGTLLLAWSRVSRLEDKNGSNEKTNVSDTNRATLDKTPPAKDNGATAGSETVIQLDASTQTVNVMKSEMPKLPAFPKLEKKPGFIRGYVYNTQGKPLKGAKIGVRSTAVGGFYSGTATQTDENGYYEVQVPSGVAHYYCAGVAVDYGEGRAALGLHPADGEAEGFASPNGTVENWVMLPYGLADRDGIQEDPRYLNNYFGGSIILSYSVDEDERFHSPTALPVNSEIEIKLIPDGPLVDGSKSRTLVIRKNVGSNSFGQLYINNIPVAHYRITARLVGGGSLKMKEVGPNGGKPFGIEPKQAMDEAALRLRPSSPRPESAVAAHGNWDQISISLERS